MICDLCKKFLNSCQFPQPMHKRITIIPYQDYTPSGYLFETVALQEHLFPLMGKYDPTTSYLLMKDRQKHYYVFVKH